MNTILHIIGVIAVGYFILDFLVLGIAGVTWVADINQTRGDDPQEDDDASETR